MISTIFIIISSKICISTSYLLNQVFLVYSISHIWSFYHRYHLYQLVLHCICNVVVVLQVPGYIAAQLLGSTLAAAVLRLVFHLDDDVCSLKGDVYVGTYPSNSNTTSFVMEFIATFNLMFVISAVATDKRATGSFAGIAIGATIVLDILFSG